MGGGATAAARFSRQSVESRPAEQRSTRVGEPFTIRIHANPTTGFGWQAVYDEKALALVNRTFEPGSPNIGAGGE